MKTRIRLTSYAWLPSLLLLALPAVAQAQFTFTTNDDQITITGYTGSGGAVAIPSTANGYAVTSIGTNAFEGNSSLTSVSIPASVISIGEQAFGDCTSLTAITVDSSNPAYSNVGLGGVLYDKAQATLVQYPEGLSGPYTIPDSVTTIVDGALNNCPGLTSVNISYSVLNIGNNFINCPSLGGFTVAGFNPNYNSDVGILTDKAEMTLVRFPGGLVGSYTVPASVTSIETNAFEDSHISVVVITAGVNSIGSYAFYDCTRLAGVYFQGGSPTANNDLTVFSGDNQAVVYYVPVSSGWGATFDGLPTMLVVNPSNYGDFIYLTLNDQITITGYTGPGGVVAIPDTINGYPVTTIRNAAINAFSGSTQLTSIIIPDSVTTIGDYTFENCTSLTNATLGIGLTSIGNGIFFGCYNLTSVTIGNNVTSLGNGTFSGCTNLQGLYFQGNSPTPNNDTSVFSGDSHGVVYYLQGTTGWGTTFDGLPVMLSTIVSTYGDFTYTINVDNNADQITIAGYTGPGGVVTIPNTINGYPVTSIGYYAFGGNTNITSVIIPASVTSIGDYAFDYCRLTSVTIGNSVTSIGNDAFAICYSLKSVTIPDSVTSIGDYAFNGGGLTSVTIGTNVVYIGDGAFASCGLTSVTIPDSVTSIGDDAFEGCGLTSVTIGTNVVYIGVDAFECFNLTAIIVAASNPDYSSLNGVLFDKAQVTLLQFPEGLGGSYNIPDSVTSIGDDAFFVCFGLMSVNIPDSVTSIGVDAFYNCPSLTSVTIGSGVTSIGENAFEYCGSLTGVYFSGDSLTPNDDLTVFTGDNNAVVYYQPDTMGWGTTFDGLPTALLDLSADFTYTINYDATITITGFTGSGGVVIIPGTINGYPVSSIGDGEDPVFSNVGVTSVIIPDGVTSIGDEAFYGCSSLTSVTIPDSVTSIGDGVFWNCSSLTSVTIPDSVTSIGDYMFTQDYDLTSVTIPDSVTSIGDDAFDNCFLLTSVTIPASVTSIGDSAFLSCYSLTSFTVDASNPDYSSLGGVLFDKAQVTLLQFPGGLGGSYTIPDSVTSIGDDAFDNCFLLTSVTIPASVTSIGDNAFVNCSGLTSVTIPDSVTSIGDGAFLYCYSLTNITVDATNASYSSVDGVLFNKSQTTLVEYPAGLVGAYTIPAGVTSIGDYAFDYCRLTSVTIGNSVTSIGDDAFNNSYNLTAVMILDSVTSIGNDAFAICYSLTNVTIGTGVTSIGYGAFESCPSLTGVYFQGNSPTPNNDLTAFYGDNTATVYYLPGTTGWGTLFDGWPTALWLPQVQTGNGSFGVHSNQFGFNINWSGNLVVVVEAATNLADPVWVPVSTNTLTDGASSFSDPQWTNYPGRFYRLKLQ